MRLKRAASIGALALCTLVAPPDIESQEPRKLARIGVLSPELTPPFQEFEKKLRELGYIEGQNLAIEFRNAEGHADRLPGLAADLVRQKVDVILAPGPEATLRAARQATSTIPIVIIAVTYDPVPLGYVASLARPGGNITGLSLLNRELAGKRLQLLKEALPKVTRVAVLWHSAAADQFRVVEETAPSFGVQLQSLELRNPPYDYEGAFRAAARERAGAVLIVGWPGFFPERARLAKLALQTRLATMFQLARYAEAGGLMAYGVDIDDMYRRAALYVDRILKGAKPADLPVEQPTRFELIINLKTARALRLTIPRSVLIRADRVIE